MDLGTARECLGVAPGASVEEIEAAHRRMKVRFEGEIASAATDVAKASAKAVLLGVEAARDALVAAASSSWTPSFEEEAVPQPSARPPAKPASKAAGKPAGNAPRGAPPAKPSAPSATGEKPAAAAPANRRRAIVLAVAVAGVVGAAVFAFLPRGPRSDPASLRRDASLADAAWVEASANLPKATLAELAADVAAGEKALVEGDRLAAADDADGASESYRRARALFASATSRVTAAAPRTAAKDLAAAWRRLAGESPSVVPDSVKTAESEIAKADAATARGAFEEAKAGYVKAKALLGPVVRSLARLHAEERLGVVAKGVADASRRSREAFDKVRDVDSTAAGAVEAAAEATDVVPALRALAVALRAQHAFAAARASWEAEPPGAGLLAALPARLSAARKASKAGNSDDLVAAVDAVDAGIADVVPRIAAVESALAPPPPPTDASLVGEWRLDAKPFADALAVPPLALRAIARAAIRVRTFADGAFVMIGGDGEDTWTIAGTWSAAALPSSIAFTSRVEGRAPLGEPAPWEGVVAVVVPGQGTFGVADPAGKSAPWEALFSRLAPAMAAERDAAKRALDAVLSTRGALEAEATTVSEAAAGAAAAVSQAASGDELVAAQRAYVATLSKKRVLAAQRQAWDAGIESDPAKAKAAEAIVGASAALDAGKALDAVDRLDRARGFVSVLEEKAKGLGKPGAAEVSDLAGIYTLAMDLWSAPAFVKFAVDGSDVVLDLSPDGSFSLVTNVSGRLIASAGWWERREATDDVSLEALVEDRTVVAEGRPWGDAFVRLTKAKHLFGFKTAKFNVPIPWLVRVQPELQVTATGPIVAEPAEGAVLGTTEIRVKGRVDPVVPGAILKIDGKVVPLRNGVFSQVIQVEGGEGVRQVIVTYEGPGVTAATTVRKFRIDTQPPVIVVTEPSQIVASFPEGRAVIRGYVTDANLASVTLNDEPLALTYDQGRARFEAMVSLSAVGERIFDIRAKDRAGNKAQGVRRRLRFIPPSLVSFTPLPGVAASTALLLLDTPLHEATLPGLAVRVTGRMRSIDPSDVVYVNGLKMVLSGQAFGVTITFPEAGDVWITVEVLRDGVRLPGESIAVRVHLTN